MPARRDTRIEASKVRRLSPLQTFENQSPVWGIRFHSCTWREGLTPSCQLSYKVSINLAVYPGALASFRPTCRTERVSSTGAMWRTELCGADDTKVDFAVA